MEENKGISRYIAGICFALYAIISLISCLSQASFYLQYNELSALILILVGIGVHIILSVLTFMNKKSRPILIVLAANCALSLWSLVAHLSATNFLFLAYDVLLVAFLVDSFKQTNKLKVIWFVPGLLFGITAISMYGFSVRYVLIAIGYFMLARWIYDMYFKVKKKELEMADDIIVKSKQYDVKRWCKIACISGVVLIALGLICYAENVSGCRTGYTSRGTTYNRDILTILTYLIYPVGHLLYLGFLLIIISPIINWWASSYSLVVTPTKVYGLTRWGKRVDLPIDSISAVSSSMFKGIAIATSSGRIVFKFIKNRAEIYEAINNLLATRQKTPNTVSQPQAGNLDAPRTTQSDSMDDLRKAKALLDDGIISQEEFDAKKKQLLGL